VLNPNKKIFSFGFMVLHVKETSRE